MNFDFFNHFCHREKLKLLAIQSLRHPSSLQLLCFCLRNLIISFGLGSFDALLDVLFSAALSVQAILDSSFHFRFVQLPVAIAAREIIQILFSQLCNICGNSVQKVTEEIAESDPEYGQIDIKSSVVHLS